MNEGKRRKSLAAFSGLIFSILCSGAGYMVVRVFQQFFSESSAFKQYEEPISEYPTIVICTPENLNSDFLGGHYDYDIAFEIEAYNDEVVGKSKENLTTSTEKITTYFSGSCYKIRINYNILNKGIGKGTVITINLNFTDSYSFDNLPDLDFYITSEKNSNGILLNEWMDGKEEFTFKIKKSKWTKFNAWIKLSQEKHLYLSKSDTWLGKKDGCIVESYYDCLVKEIIRGNFKHFIEYNSTKCLPKYITNNTTLQCRNEEDIKDALFLLYNEYFYKSNCSKPCSIVQYSGRIDYWNYIPENRNDTCFRFYLRYASPEKATVYQEYLITNFFDMFGAVGGTLGIFIGFSFNNLFTFMINSYKNFRFRTNSVPSCKFSDQYQQHVF